MNWKKGVLIGVFGAVSAAGCTAGCMLAIAEAVDPLNEQPSSLGAPRGTPASSSGPWGFLASCAIVAGGIKLLSRGKS